MSDGLKHEKWRSITESDFVTMFIKTWFTYIAVLREIFPNVSVFTDQGVPRGDKPFLNSFNQDMLPIIRRNIKLDEIAQNLFEFYPVSMKKVLKTFPQYFFQSFYRYNENFHYSDKSVIYHKDNSLKERWQIDIKTENRYILKFHLGMSGKLYNSTYNEKVLFKIDLRDIISSAIEKDDFEETIDEMIFYKAVYDNLINQINSKLNVFITETIPNMTCIKSIKQILRYGAERATAAIRLNFENNYRYAHEAVVLNPIDSYQVIKQIPFAMFYHTYSENIYSQNKAKYDILLLEKGLEWFSGFVYQLRNALFHEIIDPLDEDWQMIFKSSYLILKQISDICIDLLNDISDDNLNGDHDFIDYLSENAFSCIDELSTHTSILSVEELTFTEKTVQHGKIILKGEVDINLELKFGPDMDNDKENGIVENKTVTCIFDCVVDENLELIRGKDGKVSYNLYLKAEN